ncbi:glycosyltransferase family 4 protein [Bradyrhizobium icense]|uniref:Glycosyl transferase n=1 Tax=Bradyrhizobium icense TaxID=1274631 RepID=A0A1B1UNT4_9BRAD|nr:glycosyltransferase family 4 protein [Bradyrhizobium icense]ANW04460.1 glycosyl transferase [Bradyrhizobium icense]
MPADLPPRRRPIEGTGLNILLLTSEFAPAMGGIGTYAREIAAAASRLGAKVTVVAPDYARQTADDDRSLPFEVARYSGGLHSMRDMPRKIMLTRRGVRGDRYDVIHAADWPFFIPVALSRWRTPARVLMTVHGTEINETQTPLKRMAIRGAGVFGPRTEVVANSRFTETLFRERFAVDPRRISAINLGVSEYWFGAPRKRREVRLAYRLAEDRLVMITVARITRRKGHHLTLAALSRLPDDLRNRITWLVVGPDGEADYVSGLRRDAEAAAACDIRFLGPQSNEDIRDLYAASDFFCLTGLPDTSGRVEGFGLVYLEAGAAGLPSVATDVGGVPDAVLADETGILVPPSAESISQAIAELAADRDLRAILAAGASSHARALSWERCAATTYGLPYTGRQASAARNIGLTA